MIRLAIIAFLLSLSACRPSKDIIQSTSSVRSDSMSVVHRCQSDSTVINRSSLSEKATNQESVHIRDTVHIRDSIVLVVDTSGTIVKQERYHDQKRSHNQDRERKSLQERTFESELKESLKQTEQLQHENKALHHLVTDYQSKIHDNAKHQRRSRLASVVLVIISLYLIKKSLKKAAPKE